MSKVVLVTGANRGIGLAIVRCLALKGYCVYANARKRESLDGLVNNEIKGNIIPIYFDVTDRQAVKDAFVRIKNESGRLDCLVNNAGILVDTTLTMLNRKIVEDIFNTNVFALFDTMAFATRIMMKQSSGGSIVNIASICGDEGGMRGQTAYSSSKGAVIALTKTAAKELGEFNIRVNSISPGFIDTDMFRSGPKKIQEDLVKGVYLNSRVGRPEEVADLCFFLCSNESSYINGQDIRIDGFSHI